MEILITNFMVGTSETSNGCEYECPLDFNGECPTNTCDCGYFCDADDSDDRW